MFCKNCGGQLNESQKFCTNCGKQINAKYVTENVNGGDGKPHISYEEYSKKKNSKRMIWIVAFLTVSFLIRTVYAAFEEARFKSTFKSMFINTCNKIAGGINANTYCTCTANSLSNDHNSEQLTDILNGYESSKKAPQELISAANSCMTEEFYDANFLNKCNVNGNQANQCSCSLSQLKNQFTLSQRMQMDFDYQDTNILPIAVTDAVRNCF